MKGFFFGAWIAAVLVVLIYLVTNKNLGEAIFFWFGVNFLGWAITELADAIRRR